MTNSTEAPWSTDPNAPRIPHSLYITEKENFAGNIIGAIFYGVIIVLFFQCMSALFNPVNRTMEGIRWGLVTYTAVMFSVVTIFVAMNLNIQSISYIENREFPGKDGIPPGPFGYQISLHSKPLSIFPYSLFLLNSWLADGLLLYRCYIIYSKNIWAIVFPCLMYLASVAMGISTDYEVAKPESTSRDSIPILHFGLSYFSITLSLNVVLTFMIAARLFLHNRNIQKMAATSSLTHTTVATMLIESCALYAATSLLYIIPFRIRDNLSYTFLPLLADVQVIAPFLIIIRVANRRAFLENTVHSRTTGLIFRKQGESTGSGGTLSGGRPTDSMDRDNGKSPGGLTVGVVTTIDFSFDDCATVPTHRASENNNPTFFITPDPQHDLDNFHRPNSV